MYVKCSIPDGEILDIPLLDGVITVDVGCKPQRICIHKKDLACQPTLLKWFSYDKSTFQMFAHLNLG